MRRISCSFSYLLSLGLLLIGSMIMGACGIRPSSPVETTIFVSPTMASSPMPTMSPSPHAVSVLEAPLSTPDDPRDEQLARIDLPDLPQRDLHALGIRYGRITSDTSRVAVVMAPERQIGERATFTIADLGSNRHMQVDAELRAIGTHAYWWVQVGMTVDEDALAAAVTRFDEEIYERERRLFGEEWSPGVDGETRVHIFLGDVRGAGGYYSSADEFVRAINPFSNEKEIFYINLNNRRPGQPGFDEILAHEYQHMIHWNEDRNEATWVNEGLSELAMRLTGFNPARAAREYLLSPDWPLTNWPDQSARAYGSAFLFFDYWYDRFGETRLRQLVAEPANGPHGLSRVQGIPFDEIFADWTVALLLDKPDGGRYAFPSRDLEGVYITRTFRRYPVDFTETVAQYGIDYLRFQPSNEFSGTLLIEFDGNDDVPLLPTTPPSGAFAFWSHRGDDINTTLTRAFDLRQVERATLIFSAWYDIEQDFDYVYVSVSTDGGKRWRALSTDHTTTRNPNGNALGPGFTGVSGGGETPTWVENRVDLTPFVGQEILIRFEMVNDDALNRDGFWLDDVRIPEIGYATDFEHDDGGWEANGWVRVHNRLPQRFIVQAVSLKASDEKVQRFRLDEENRGRIEIPSFGDDVKAVILIVSGATPITTQRASYRVTADVQP